METITDADYPDALALLTNTPAQAKSLLHRLEQEAGGISLHENLDKTELLFFNRNGDILFNGKSLKLVNQFICFGCNISSIESDVNTRIGEA